MKGLIKSKFKEQNVPCYGGTVNLEIRKYTRKVFFENLWKTNDDLIKSRGAVFIDGKQVVIPMDKCFNYGENGVGINLPMDTKVKVYRKYNGYMLNLTFVDKVGWVLSTTGDAMVFGNEEKSNKFLTMWQDLNKDFDIFSCYQSIADKYDLWETQFTMTFEICHPDDAHIIEEDYGIYPLCYQANGKTHPLGEFKVTTLGELIESNRKVQHEGFMVYNLADELLFKFKSQFYLGKKWIQRGNSKAVYDKGYREYMDEEFYPIIDAIRGLHSKEVWDTMSENEKAECFKKVYKELTSNIKEW